MRRCCTFIHCPLCILAHFHGLLGVCFQEIDGDESADEDKASGSKESNSRSSSLTLIAWTSLSKYYSGGSCIGGAIISDDKEFMSAVQKWIEVHGHHVSPIHCQRVLKNMSLMNERIAKTSAMTLNVARFLSNSKNAVDVRYPLLENHISHGMTKRFWTEKKYGPSVLHFKVAVPQIKTDDDAWECMEQWKIDGLGFERKTSYGGKDTRFEQMDNPVEEDGFWVRMAIGFADEENEVIDLLKKLFASLDTNASENQ